MDRKTRNIDYKSPVIDQNKCGNSYIQKDCLLSHWVRAKCFLGGIEQLGNYLEKNEIRSIYHTIHKNKLKIYWRSKG